MSNKFVGIDLGTTYSAIALINEFGQPEIMPNSDGDLTTPSVVYFENERNIVVGQTAKDEAIRQPEKVVSMVKREIGNADWHHMADGQAFDATTVSSLILKHLVQEVAEQTGEPVTNAVITVPAYFGSGRRTATRQAGQAAGLIVPRVISEPVAAALFFGLTETEDQTIMVYDLGGGTFDTTVIQIKDNHFNVITTAGSSKLGGKNWDEALVNELAAQFTDENSHISADELKADLETWQDLMREAEKMKKALSKKESVRATVRHGEEKLFTATVSRADFDTLTGNLLDETIMYMRKAMAEAEKKGVADIDTILLVGGSTYMPQVKERLAQEFDVPIQMNEPNQAVAKGAAIFANILEVDKILADKLDHITDEDGSIDPEEARALTEQAAMEQGTTVENIEKTRSITLSDVSPKTFGIVVVGDSTPDDGQMYVRNLVLRNQTVPASVTASFSTAFEGQSVAKLECVEWEDEATETDEKPPYNPDTKLGEAVLDLGAPRPRGHRFDVTLQLSEDGRVMLDAKDPESGKTVAAEWQAAGLRSESEMKDLTAQIGSIQVHS